MPERRPSENILQMMAAFLKYGSEAASGVGVSGGEEGAFGLGEPREGHTAAGALLASSSDVAAALLRALWYKGLVDLGLGEA